MQTGSQGSQGGAAEKSSEAGQEDMPLAKSFDMNYTQHIAFRDFVRKRQKSCLMTCLRYKEIPVLSVNKILKRVRIKEMQFLFQSEWPGDFMKRDPQAEAEIPGKASESPVETGSSLTS